MPEVSLIHAILTLGCKLNHALIDGQGFRRRTNGWKYSNNQTIGTNHFYSLGLLVSKALLSCVNHVFRVCHPFQIVRMVIGFNSIYMVHFCLIHRLGNKRGCNQFMNGASCLSSADMHPNNRISFWMRWLKQPFPNISSAATDSGKTFNPTKITDLISTLKSVYVSPYFHGRKFGITNEIYK